MVDKVEVQKCIICQRERQIGPEHPMDSYDYNPMQVVMGQPLGWYSGDDGEICPEDITKMLRNQ
jgi:hypothetical protein